MEEIRLLRHISALKKRLVEQVDMKGTFLDPDVIDLSQRLDKLIVRFQQIRSGNQSCG